MKSKFFQIVDGDRICTINSEAIAMLVHYNDGDELSTLTLISGYDIVISNEVAKKIAENVMYM